MKTPKKAAAVLNAGGTEVTITVEGQEGETFNNQFDALKHILHLIDTTEVDTESLSEIRTVVKEAQSLPQTEEGKAITVFEFLQIKAVNESFVASIFGDPLSALIAEYFLSSSLFQYTAANKPMKMPTFNLCSNCQRHGHFLDDDGNRASHEIGSRDDAFKWIKEALTNGFITDKKAGELEASINSAKKIGQSNKEFQIFIVEEFLLEI